MASVIYESLNPTTIFSSLSIGYVVGNKTKNTMCGPPTTIGRFTDDQSIPLEGEEEERLIERDRSWSFRTVAIIARRQADSRGCRSVLMSPGDGFG